MSHFNFSTADRASRSTNKHRRWRWHGRAVAVATALIATAGCGSSEAANGGGSDNDPASIRAEYSNCMRDQGLEGFTYETDGNEVEHEPEPNAVELDIDDLNEANEQCQYILNKIEDPLDNLDADQEAAYDDWTLAVTKCLEAKGFDVSKDEQTMEEADWNAYDAAYEECTDEVPIPTDLEGILNP